MPRGPEFKATFSLGDDARAPILVATSKYILGEVYLPYMTRQAGHCDQELPELHSEVILIRFEIPTNLFSSGSGHFKGKFPQTRRCVFILREYGA